MIKNILFFIIFFLYSISFYAQNTEICGEVTYNHIYTYPGHTYKAEFAMKFNADVSFAEQINIKPTKATKFDYYGDQGNERNYVQEVKADEKMFYYNSNEGFFFLIYLVSGTPLLVKEDDFNWQWEITDETKKIGDFVCQKAITSFRGNKYEAWFTPEIPVSYGPWKFNGLPGLILEVLSENKVFYFVATNIKIDQKNDCNIAVETTQFKKAIDIHTYRLKIKDDMRRVAARLSSLQPKGSDPIEFLDEKECVDCILLERFESEK